MDTQQHPNAARIAKFYARLDSAVDAEAAHEMFVDAFAENAVWHHLGDCQHAQTYEGRDAIITQLTAAMVQDSGGTWTPTLLEVLAFGEEIVVVHMNETAEIAGERDEGHVALTLRLVDGRIVEAVRVMDRSLDAHWATAALTSD